MYKHFVRVFVAVSLISVGQLAEAAECQDDPAVIAQCFTVHGRVARYADGLVFPWPVGTKRLLDIAYPPTSSRDGAEPFMPDGLRTLVDADAVVFGDFELCPFERDKPRVMRHVCIQSASHLVVQHR